MDMTESIQPKSDQINSDDLMAGPVTVTVTGVTAGSAEQPFNFHTHEFPNRAYRPSKSMRRVIVSAWGKDTKAYEGKRMTLFRNPNIKFGKDAVGGIQISHMSGLEKPLSLALTVTRGKRAPFTVQPLIEAAPVISITPEQWTEITQAAGASGITDVPGFVIDTIGRQINGPADIRSDEYNLIINKINEMENK